MVEGKLVSVKFVSYRVLLENVKGFGRGGCHKGYFVYNVVTGPVLRTPVGTEEKKGESDCKLGSWSELSKESRLYLR